MMRDAILSAARITLGGYLAAHGAQKLFGVFGGHGIEGTAGFFESVGLEPGRPHAIAAGVAETLGGTLTALGLAGPVGPITIASTMGVAAGTVHRDQGPFNTDGGPELPIMNAAASALVAVAGPGRLSLDRALGLRVPPKLVALVAAGAAITSAALVTRARRATLAGDHENDDDIASNRHAAA
jgi:putative oxidoreductase